MTRMTTWRYVYSAQITASWSRSPLGKVCDLGWVLVDARGSLEDYRLKLVPHLVWNCFRSGGTLTFNLTLSYDLCSYGWQRNDAETYCWLA